MYCSGSSMPTFFIKTYGCQMNERDSEQVAHSLLARGYERVAHESLNAILGDGEDLGVDRIGVGDGRVGGGRRGHGAIIGDYLPFFFPFTFFFASACSFSVCAAAAAASSFASAALSSSMVASCICALACIGGQPFIVGPMQDCEAGFHIWQS